MNRVAPFLFLAIGLLVVEPGAAQDDSIAGVWRAREESASGILPGVNASDIQTMWLSPSGQYRREIVVEGGDGVNGAGGMIVDSGASSRRKRFSIPATAGWFAPSGVAYRDSRSGQILGRCRLS